MNMKKTTLAAAVTAVLALGAVGQASASVYGTSGLDIRNLSIVVTPAAGSTPNAFEFTTTNTATLNGVSSPTQSASCGGFPNSCSAVSPVLDAAPANAPGGTINRANNDFSMFGPSGNTYANADSVITTAQLVQGVPSSTRQIAESELQTTGSARSNAEITSNTGFTFTFTLAAPGSLTLSFEADPHLRAYINQLAFTSGSAQANLQTGFSLTNNATSDAVTWNPQGTPGTNNCDVDAGLVGVACAENNDAEDLNRVLSVSSNPADVSYSLAAGWSLFGITISGLQAGEYTLALSALTSTSVRTVPEPSILALLGIAAVGMGAVSRRRKQAV